MASIAASLEGEAYVLDLSSIMRGAPTSLIEKGSLGPGSKIYVHRAILTYLERLAAEGRSLGLASLEELSSLARLASQKGLEVIFVGDTPRDPRNLDPLILSAAARELARELNAVLVTSDEVSRLAASALGLRVVYLPGNKRRGRLKLEEFFDERTMSVHLIEGAPPVAKRGTPGYWVFEKITEKPLSREEIQEIVEEIVEEAKSREDSFIEIDRAGSTIVQLERYRIIVVKPPMGSRWEVTAVRPLVKLSLSDYELGSKLLERLEQRAEGILVAGAPGMGKTTFAQALAEYYASKGKIVKTIESPRDMVLPPNIVQYSKHLAEKGELHDILLLSRPDYTVFDELRTDEDFKLYVDLRLAGIGMIGVLHATSPIDAIQRFIGRVELGVIPSIVDTLIFLDKGTVRKVYEITMTIKLPTGLKEAELSRPVVEVRDFITGELEYELYTFGEQVVVVPVRRSKEKPKSSLKAQIERLLPEATVEIDDVAVIVRVPREAARAASRKLRKIRRVAEKHNLELRIEAENGR
ncbi:MAG: ATPase, T2SS/T4P/T4SS family [Fervidicoccaceae archaeon]